MSDGYLAVMSEKMSAGEIKASGSEIEGDSEGKRQHREEDTIA